MVSRLKLLLVSKPKEVRLKSRWKIFSRGNTLDWSLLGKDDLTKLAKFPKVIDNQDHNYPNPLTAQWDISIDIFILKKDQHLLWKFYLVVQQYKIVVEHT